MASDHSTVEYRGVPDYPAYRVGTDGSVWTCWRRTGRGNGYAKQLTDRWRRMNPVINDKGYPSVNLTKESGTPYKTFRVHRLVLLAFVGPCPEGMECRHLNGVRADCRLENLAWGTRDENVEDRRRHRNYSPRVRLYTHDGQTLPLKEWARIFGIEYNCLWQRVNKLGMSFEEAVARPYLGTASNGGHWTAAKRAKGS